MAKNTAKEVNMQFGKPVRVSEVSCFAQCRQKWHWSYNLGLKTKGSTPAILGTLGHRYLEIWQVGGTKVEAVNAEIRHHCAKYGLCDEERAHIVDESYSVMDMCDYYIENVGKKDEYQTWQWDDSPASKTVELDFKASVPHGGLQLFGRMDRIVQKGDELWVMDYKFKKQRQWRDYEDVIMSLSTVLYSWALQYLLQLNFGYQAGSKLRVGTPWKRMGVIIDEISMYPPKDPTILKSGAVSRADCATTWPHYKAFCTEIGLDWQDYLDMKDKLASKKFVNRIMCPISDTQLEGMGRLVQQICFEMRNKHVRMYPCFDMLRCKMCHFKELCMALMQGADMDGLMDSMFELRQETERSASHAED